MLIDSERKTKATWHQKRINMRCSHRNTIFQNHALLAVRARFPRFEISSWESKPIKHRSKHEVDMGKHLGGCVFQYPSLCQLSTWSKRPNTNDILIVHAKNRLKWPPKRSPHCKKNGLKIIAKLILGIRSALLGSSLRRYEHQEADRAEIERTIFENRTKSASRDPPKMEPKSHKNQSQN